MRRRRVPLGIVLPIGLVLLVGLLAALQYRWLGQVSEAEREQLRTTLSHRALEFARDFDREIGRAYVMFQHSGVALDQADPAVFLQRYELWRAEAQYPDMVRGIYYAADPEGASTLYAFRPDEGDFVEVPWPSRLTPIRARLEPLEVRLSETAEPPRLMRLAGLPVITDIPAIVVPLPDPVSEPAQVSEPADRARRAVGDRVDVVVALHLGRRFLIVELDEAYLRETVLPALVERHFPDDGADRYRVSIVDANGAPVLTRGTDPTRAIPADAADAAEPFFSLRLDLARDLSRQNRIFTWTADRQAAAEAVDFSGVADADVTRGRMSIVVQRTTEAPAAVAHFETGFGNPGWRVLLQHAAGSLDAAVARARTRNLYLSFGILALLAAAVSLIVLNARRSERLAGQQMDFVATVSHELRTPLAVIRSAAQNLSAGVVHDADQARRYGELIDGEGRRLSDMVEQVLEYAGLAGNRPPPPARPVDVGDLVRDTMAASRELPDADGLDISVDVDPDLPPVAADEGALRRALQNLVTNAMKYGADGRWLAVAARRGTAGGRDEVQLSVSDRGRGIEPEELPHIFDPFYRGRYAIDRQIHGNGLGLSLVRRIAEAHGGRVSVASSRATGTTFTIHLPAAAPDGHVAALGDPVPTSGGPSA